MLATSWSSVRRVFSSVRMGSGGAGARWMAGWSLTWSVLHLRSPEDHALTIGRGHQLPSILAGMHQRLIDRRPLLGVELLAIHEPDTYVRFAEATRDSPGHVLPPLHVSPLPPAGLTPLQIRRRVDHGAGVGRLDLDRDAAQRAGAAGLDRPRTSPDGIRYGQGRCHQVNAASH